MKMKCNELNDIVIATMEDIDIDTNNKSECQRKKEMIDFLMYQKHVMNIIEVAKELNKTYNIYMTEVFRFKLKDNMDISETMKKEIFEVIDLLKVNTE